MTTDQFKNLLAFLCLMANEEGCEYLLNKHPEYILEKWHHYVQGSLPTGEGWRWGLHPGLREVFDTYIEQWGVDERTWWDEPGTFVRSESTIEEL